MKYWLHLYMRAINKIPNAQSINTFDFYAKRCTHFSPFLQIYARLLTGNTSSCQLFVDGAHRKASILDWCFGMLDSVYIDTHSKTELYVVHVVHANTNEPYRWKKRRKTHFQVALQWSVCIKNSLLSVCLWT